MVKRVLPKGFSNILKIEKIGSNNLLYKLTKICYNIL